MPETSEKNPAPHRKPHSLARSFGFAAEGLWYALRTQRNFRIQLIAAVIAFAGAIYLQFSPVQWTLLILTAAAVLILELLNTVAETIVDLVSPEYHPLAKTAKDLAAAAVLLASLTALAVGFLLFIMK